MKYQDLIINKPQNVLETLRISQNSKKSVLDQSNYSVNYRTLSVQQTVVPNVILIHITLISSNKCFFLKIPFTRFYFL